MLVGVPFPPPAAAAAGASPAGACSQPNAVRTTRSSPLSFVPLNLVEQFHARPCYLYFLALIVLNQLPQLAVFGRAASAAPLLAVVAATAAKDALEELRRWRADGRANARRCEVLRGGALAQVAWGEVREGELVVLREGHGAPADLALLAAAGGAAFVDTAALDGERALKRRVTARAAQAAASQAAVAAPEECATLCGTLLRPPPDGELDTFRGEARVGDEPPAPLTPAHALLRGSVLRLTPWAVGVAVHVGHNTKIMVAASQPPAKRTALERAANVHMIALGALLAVLCTIGASIAAVGVPVPTERSPWLGLGMPLSDWPQSSSLSLFMITWFGLLILYQILVPISLFITMEVVRLAQAYLMSADPELYVATSDQRCVVNSLTVNEDLGCVGIVLADKTGTLTANRMTLSAVATPGREWLDDTSGEEGAFGDDEGPPDSLAAMRRALGDSAAEVALLCNTVVVAPTADLAEGDAYARGSGEAGAPTVAPFQGESPDEVAMVEALERAGVALRRPGARECAVCYSSQGIAACEDNGSIAVERTVERYEVLGEHAFDSERKFMSVVVAKGGATADGGADVLVKGADEALLPLAAEAGAGGGESSGGGTCMSREAAAAATERFARHGLRTMVLARRRLSAEERIEWAVLYAKSASAGSASEAEGLADLAERKAIGDGLHLVGVVGIRDELQAGAHDTVVDLRAAGASVWMLTGDKMETALAVARNAGLLDVAAGGGAPFEGQQRMEPSIVSMQRSAEHALHLLHEAAARGSRGAVILPGAVLARLLACEGGEAALCEVAAAGAAAVVCRVSPSQKAAVARVAKVAAEQHGCTCLAVGDGANDVGMLRVAHVGVGIAGSEGRRAAMAADVAVGAFRALRTLLLVHGHWSYTRMAQLVLYNFYRNAVFVFVLFLYTPFAGYSTMSCIDQWNLVMYSLAFTSVPTVVVGFTEQDAPREALLSSPSLYAAGIQRRLYSHALFGLSIADAAWQAVAVFWVTTGALSAGGSAGMHDAPTGLSMGELGAAQLAALVIVANATLLMDVRYLSWPAAVAFGGSVLFAVGWQAAAASAVSAPWAGAWAHVAASRRWWLAVLLACTAALGPRAAGKALVRALAPSAATLARAEWLKPADAHRLLRTVSPPASPTLRARPATVELTDQL